MQRQTTVSFSDCSSSAGGLEGDKRERYSNSDRMGSRKSILSGIYRRDSDDSGGEDCRRKFSNSPVEAAGVRLYCKDMVPQSNGRWGAQTYEKCQREWPGTFNGKDETAKALTAFNLGRPADAITEMKPQLQVGHPETRLLGVHSHGQIVSKHDYEEETGHSKKIDRSRCSEADQEKEEGEFKGSGGGKGDKKASSWRREHMFEKAVTPSDVGKLNRLVIPKQHAKKYFPLDTDANEKGLLLNFEDSAGKAWRFRYSYWNSSQSYVFTKGWSRFVKEKKLDDGDIVSFDRATHQDPNLQRLFISCKRKPSNAAQPPGLPGSIKRPLQFRSPFQFPYDAIYNIGGSHGQHLVTSRALIGPQRSPLFSPTNNNVGGESSRGASETRNMETTYKPMDLLTSLHFITSDDKSRKGIHEYSAFPFSTRRSSDTIESGRVDTESSDRKTSPLRTMHFKTPGSSPDDLSAATSFDHSTSAFPSKKVVRLFGVNLECGKFNDNYEDELLLIRQAEPLFSQITEGAKQVKRNCRYTEFLAGGN